jgi:hypothetical protein
LHASRQAQGLRLILRLPSGAQRRRGPLNSNVRLHKPTLLKMSDVSSFVLALAFAASVGLYAIVTQRVIDRRNRLRAKKIEVEGYYDHECMGVREVLSGDKHVFPICLVQQIDVFNGSSTPLGYVSVDVTAEFHSASFNFSLSECEGFVQTMERVLPCFEGTRAREQVRNAFESGDIETVYISPWYLEGGFSS